MRIAQLSLASLLALFSLEAHAVISLDTHASHQGTASSVSSVALTLTSVTAGDLITCETTMDSGGSANSMAVSDSSNGSYSVGVAIQKQIDSAQYAAIFYFQNAAAGTYTITLAPSPGTAGYVGLSCQAWKGAATSSVLDSSFVQYKYQATSSANPTTGTSLSPSAGGELILGLLTTSASTPTAGSASYTLIDSQTTCLVFPEYWIQGSTTPTNAPFTMSSDHWLDEMVAFKPAGATSVPTGYLIIQ